MAENETEKQETVTEPTLSDQKPAEQPEKPKKKVNLAAQQETQIRRPCHGDHLRGGCHRSSA